MADKIYRIAIGGRPFQEAEYGDVVSLMVDETTGMPSRFELRLATTQGNNGSYVYAEPRFFVFDSVTIGIGVSIGGGAGAIQPVFSGYLTSVGIESGSEPGRSQVVLKGLDKRIALGLEEKVAAWLNLSDGQIVEQIVNKYGLPARINRPGSVHEQVMQRGTDLDFIRELAARNGCEFYFEDDPESDRLEAVFETPNLFQTAKPLAIGFGEESNLRSLHVELSGLRPVIATTTQVDIGTGRVETEFGRTSGITTLGAAGPEQFTVPQAVAPTENGSQVLVLGAPSSDPVEMATLAQAVHEESSWFVRALGEINSDAYGSVLRPHRLVSIRGTGRGFNGEYYVTRVMHELSGDGAYVQRFEARRNGFGVSPPRALFRLPIAV